jgi:DNA-binding MarR family transcriptional regulator
LIDVLETEMERDNGLPIRWYDVLIHLEDAPDGERMNEIAGRILYSKSGLTRVIDGMEEAGLVRRVRPEHDRRSIFVVLTDEGRETMERVRRQHRLWIEEHFSRHLADEDIGPLTRALEKLNAHAGTLRPRRISS